MLSRMHLVAKLCVFQIASDLPSVIMNTLGVSGQLAILQLCREYIFCPRSAKRPCTSIFDTFPYSNNVQ